MTHVASVGPSKSQVIYFLCQLFNPRSRKVLIFFSGFQFKAYFWDVIYWLQKLEDKKSEEVEAQVINIWWFDGR